MRSKAVERTKYFYHAKWKIDELRLFWNSKPIKNVTELAILGVIFDTPLNFAASVEKNLVSATKKLNYLRRVMFKEARPSRFGTRDLIISKCYSVLDYGSAILAVGLKSNKDLLDRVSNVFMRYILNVPTQTPSIAITHE